MFQNSIKLSLLLAVMATVSACVTTATPYRPADSSHGHGYHEQKIEENRYRVTFSGNSQTSRETVENYLLYRAAELTLEQGADYFIVVNTQTEKDTRHSTTYIGGSPFYYGRGFGFGFGLSGITSSLSDYEAYGTIVLNKGAKPQNNPHAYQASEVIENLGKLVVRPEVKE